MSSGDDENEIDLSEWMTNLPLAVRQKPITKIAIPGSHDSFAFSSSLTTSLPVSNDSSNSLRRAGSIPGVRRFIKRWAITQNLDISSQLSLGIRYLDLRVSNPPQNDDPDSSFRCVHALYGSPLIEIVETVKEFLQKHPKEVVFIDMNHLYGFKEDAAFTDMMQTLLCLLSPSQIVPPPSNDRPFSDYTLELLQESGQNVMLMAPFLGESTPFTEILWSTRHIQSPWPDSDKIPYILQFLTRLSEEWRMQSNPSSLMVYQGVATVKGRDIALHPLSSLEKYVARSMTTATIGWLSSRSSSDGINIVIADFVSSEFCRLIVDINDKK
ncbi:hypothetical protein PFISCL1PPCAC_16111 [Pristionchus fissidentatus]|uniref:Phosphatidylinositol-specific phospholipase C X domain-containing protein n=1 Tax=Pristionchus fissidentatus TaxID=1538716 RepID=A0AAV5VYW0_9BILA|nr:hypothetical protein PFISCL1PPCAC_16111 [Pristionchus fissidentatus]